MNSFFPKEKETKRLPMKSDEDFFLFLVEHYAHKRMLLGIIYHQTHNTETFLVVLC